MLCHIPHVRIKSKVRMTEMKIYMDITEVSGQTWALSATAQGLNPNLAICFLGGSAGKESAGDVGDLGLIPGLGRSPSEGKGYPLQYSGLENSMNCRVHGVTKSQTQLSNFHT